jgi:hypothetical protein
VERIYIASSRISKGQGYQGFLRKKALISRLLKEKEQGYQGFLRKRAGSSFGKKG